MSGHKPKNQAIAAKFFTPLFLDKVLDTGEALVCLAEMAIGLRGRPKPWEIAALAVRGTQSGLLIYRAWKRPNETEDPANFFSNDPTWVKLNDVDRKALFLGAPPCGAIIEDEHFIRRCEDRSVSMAPYTVMYHGVEFGWPGDDSPVMNNVEHDGRWIFYRQAEGVETRLAALVSERLWQPAHPTFLLQVDDNGIGHRTQPRTDLYETSFIRSLEARIRQFWAAGKSRSYVLDGEPGTGKGTAALEVAQRLKAKTVFIDADTFIDNSSHSPDGLHLGQWNALQRMQPEMIVLNDLDRLDQYAQLSLFGFLEQAKRFARVIIVTTNDARRLTEALRRPGRLDEQINVPGVEHGEVQALLGANFPANQAARMLGWPIAYVLDVRDRLEVLGHGSLDDEIDAVEKRLQMVRGTDLNEDPDTDDLPVQYLHKRDGL